METSDFLQADDILKLIKVPFAINKGHITDDEIEQFIGADSKGRQGRYYRLAAEKFGLVLNTNNTSSLTDRGRYFVNLKDHKDHMEFIASIMRETEVFKQAIAFLESSNPRPELGALKGWFIRNYPGSNSTAIRRYSTLINYLRATGFIL